MPDHDDYFDEEELEAYCVSCKEKRVIENPQAVWTRKGTPATRGECEVCGNTVFRMGKTDAHRGMVQPEAVKVGDFTVKGTAAKLATFVVCAASDAEIAGKLTEDLKNNGFPTWLDEIRPGEEVAWAGGVHPALDQCTRMVVVMSPATLKSERAQSAWEYFKSKRKLVTVAQVAAIDEVPDDLRRSPRYDFDADYSTALRQLVQALM